MEKIEVDIFDDMEMASHIFNDIQKVISFSKKEIIKEKNKANEDAIICLALSSTVALFIRSVYEKEKEKWELDKLIKEFTCQVKNELIKTLEMVGDFETLKSLINEKE